MSIPKNLPDVVQWAMSILLIALSSVVLYFVKDMHSDFKAMQTKVELLELSSATGKVEISNIKQSITELKSKPWQKQ